VSGECCELPLRRLGAVERIYVVLRNRCKEVRHSGYKANFI